jgi:uncharacterized protein (UPF0210 family)
MRNLLNRAVDLCLMAECRWFCFPLDLTHAPISQDISKLSARILHDYPQAFINIILTNDHVLDLNRVYLASKMILANSIKGKDGFDNFRFGISCNVQPHSPYFPYAWHSSEDGFSVAVETSDLVYKYLQSHKISDFGSLKKKLIDYLTAEFRVVDEECREIENATGMKYYGIDTSLAPFPSSTESIAEIYSRIGITGFGGHGTLFVTGFITDILKEIARTDIRTIGFNGVMFSLLEDMGIGIENETKKFSIDSLLLYSALCGCGLDMIPIPGSTSAEKISSIILDVYAMSVKLEKQLGVRLLPVPGKEEGKFTNYHHDFIYNTLIKDIGLNHCSLLMLKDNSYTFNKK